MSGGVQKVATKVPIYKEFGHQCQRASSPVRL